ncbi:DUF1295 domain-containing protein [Actinokineospora sp. NBRC 105648]|uniref:DUF1295 domain-containing protein n=1 Tax=Actinokineospora sp. NBRC 105648 TaxID=3032206 RepID=UPI0024A5AC33|nr:DUF1295 domain-containing protein [Actinokineospora sp. NBRC 105648]GLZ40252.1 membrane protein [Actinokineospora sp. NBRC 105648]
MSLLLNLAATLVAVVVVLAITFAISVRRGKFDTIDTVWGLGFAVIAIVTFALSTGDLAVRLVATVLPVVWGVRLAVHLHRRNRGKPEDRRYVKILADAKGSPLAHMARVVFLPQGAIMWFVSLPVQVAQYSTFGPIAYAGIAVWLTGFVFESVGDWQLSRFSADPANKGTVLDTGLWRYTRHPNYFGDACVWWGLYLVACSSWLGAATVLSPVLMTFMLAKGTGKPLTEKHLSSSRPGYADYVARTSGFFPLPPRKRGAPA